MTLEERRRQIAPHLEIYGENEVLKCEEGRKFYLETKNASFIKVKIDGGVEPNGMAPKKCDYMVIKNEIEDIEIFIELKGNKIKDAT